MEHLIKNDLTEITQLRQELKGAYQFNNTEAMWNITNRLLTVYARMTDRLLKSYGQTDASNSVCSPISTDVNVADNPTLNFGSPDGHRLK